MYTMALEDGSYVIRRPDGELLFTIDTDSPAFAEAILWNLNNPDGPKKGED